VISLSLCEHLELTFVTYHGWEFHATIHVPSFHYLHMSFSLSQITPGANVQVFVIQVNAKELGFDTGSYTTISKVIFLIKYH
jgi:hypothetical protein